jgi:hypothetical protein
MPWKRVKGKGDEGLGHMVILSLPLICAFVFVFVFVCVQQAEDVHRTISPKNADVERECPTYA